MNLRMKLEEEKYFGDEDSIFDYDNCLPKFLINDLDNLKLEDEESEFGGDLKIGQGQREKFTSKVTQDIINEMGSRRNKDFYQMNNPGGLPNTMLGRGNSSDFYLNNFGVQNNVPGVFNQGNQMGMGGIFQPTRNKYWSSENVGINGQKLGNGYPNNLGRGFSNNWMINNQNNCNPNFPQQFSSYSNNGNNGGNWNNIPQQHSQFYQQSINFMNLSNQQNLSNSNFSPNTPSKKNSIKNVTSNLFDVSLNNYNNPKRTQSSQNIAKKILNSSGEWSPSNSFTKNPLQMKSNFKSNSKIKASKFCKEEFESFEELMQNVENRQIDLIPYICTQKGSRALQNIVESVSSEKLDIILETLKNHISFLMMDVYGNYLCQKLIQNSSPSQRLFILQNISQKFCDIARNSSGTHSLQSLIEIINLKDEEDIIKLSVENSIIILSLDLNGTHVIQKILSSVDEKDRQFINIVIVENFVKLIYDSNGICVLKKFVKGNEDLELRKLFINGVLSSPLEVIQNPFGNYIVQYIFDEWGIDVCRDIFNVVIQNLNSLSMQKFSSNVVEKCIDFADEATRQIIIKEIFTNFKVPSLLKNKYGSFVLQKAVSILRNEERKEIKDDLVKKINLVSNKDKVRMNSILDLL